MASLNAFLSVMQEFLSELKVAFPNEKNIVVYDTAFCTMKKANPRKVLNSFLDAVQSFSDKIVSRDETFITDGKNELITELNINECWLKASDNTKDAIWQYLNTLYVLATTISSIPQSLLTSIEGMAEGLATDMDGKQEMPDLGTLMAGMQNVIGGMAKKK
jgi:hypothetical protein